MENEKLTLVEHFWDENKKKIQRRFFLDENNHFQGEYKSWYRNGQLESCFNYKDDVEFGKCIWFYKNGQFEIISHYKGGELHGKRQAWIELGWRISIDTYHFKKGTHGTEIEFK